MVEEVGFLVVHSKVSLKAECPTRNNDLLNAVTQTLQTQCKVRGTVELCEPGSLPNDGAVISDERDYNA